MGSLFGELSTVAQFIIAFLIVLALIVVTFWGIRRFGGAGLGANATRGRQPRLAVIDAAVVDNRRRLVLIRRDNVEHLLMIGGPSDVVIEQNIVRAVPVASARDAAAATRASGLSEVMARASEPAASPRELPAREMPAREPDTSRAEPTMPRGLEFPSVLPEAPQRPQPAAKPEPAPQPRRVEPAVRPPAPAESPGRPHEVPMRSAPPITPASRGAAEPAMPQARAIPPASDAELTDMAQRLEAALRRPAGSGQVRTEPSLKPAPAPEAAPRPAAIPFGAPPREAPKAPPVKPEPPRAVASEAAPTGNQPEPKSKSVLDSLEQEMASLLGRPLGKE